MDKTTEKRPLFTMSRVVTALVWFTAFLVVALGGYYMSAGEFVSARLAAIYAVLALVGALAVFFRLRRFAFFYYAGCALGWVVGWYISGLKGEFAPTFGTICTISFIAIFALLGIMSQWDGVKKQRAKRKAAEAKALQEAEEARLQAEREAEEAQKAAEEARQQAELAAARQARESAEAAMAQAAGESETADAAPIDLVLPGEDAQPPVSAS